MIQNPGFEEEWEDNHTCHIFPEDEPSYITDVGNIFTPKGWTFFFRHKPGTWDQPEGRDAWAIHDPHRVHSGRKAFMFFTFYRKHDAGLYQQVEVTPGTKLTLSAHAHAWSNGLESGHLHDGRWSDGSLVGYNTIALKPEDIPELNGDPQNDANGNFLFTVGIDPLGGTNPYSDTVVWGDPYHIYNGYCQKLSVDAIAQSATVTVFLRSVTMWGFNHNDAYWDDVSLIEDTPTECRGAPRVQYNRTYVLMPPSATSAMVESVSRWIWNDHRCTIGGSADDAGIGDLDNRRVVAINPHEWNGDLAAFYREYYPGVAYAPITATVENAGEKVRELLTPMPPPSILLGQCDSPWGSIRYAGGRCSTICSLGCWVTACAMTQRHYDIDKDATPDKVDEIVGSAGYSANCGMLWSAMPKLGLKVIKRTSNSTEANTHLDGGDVCFAEVLPRSLQHFVLITKRENGRYWMFDPWKRIEGWLDDTYQGIESWRLIKEYQEPPPPPATGGHVGMHLQTMTGGWDTFTSELKPPVMKVLASMQDVLGIKRQNRDTAVVWRHVTNAYHDTLEHPDPRQGAENWIDKFRDSLYEVCNQTAQEFPGLKEPYFYVESLNEVYPSLNGPHVLRAANFDVAFIDALEGTGLPVKPVVFCAAVGNPHESEYNLLVPLARKCQAVNGLMGYHNYWFANQNESGLESWWKYHAGRWTEMDKVFVQNGVHVRWYGGESGAVGSPDGYNLLPNDGWKSPECYGGNWDRYLADILKLNQLTANWNSTHGNRYLGSVLFTTGEPFCGWPHFQIQGDETRDLIDALCL